MTASELKAKIESAGTNPYFFTRDTMIFFGDTMKNYGVRERIINTYRKENVPVWELYRKRPVKHGLKNSAFFNQVTFEKENEREAAV